MKYRWLAGGSAMALPAAGLAFLVIHSGCSSSSSQPTKAQGAAVSAGAEAGGPMAAGDTATFKLTWLVGRNAFPGSGPQDAGAAMGDASTQFPPIEGVKVCAQGHPEIDCVVTAADGSFTIAGLPGGADVALTLEKPGYVSQIQPIEMGRTDEQNTFPILMSLASDPEPDLGVAIDPTLGTVSFFVISLSALPIDAGGVEDAGSGGFFPVRGATLSISPDSGSGPYYLDNNNQVALDAGGMVGITGAFYNVAPGDYTISVDTPNANCTPISFPYGSNGYPIPSVPHGVGFPVVAGYMDGIGVLCTRNARIVPIPDGG